MDGRYLLLAARPGAERAAAAAAARLAAALAWPSMTLGRHGFLLTDPAVPPPMLAAMDATIIGRIFRRHGATRPLAVFDDADRMAISTWREDYFAERCWGDYLAIILNGAELRVLRAPLGASPCFYSTTASIVAFASDAALLCHAGLVAPLIDWSAVAQTLYAPDLPLAETALTGVRELLPGCVALIDDETRIRERWSPWAYAHPARVEPDISTVRRTIETTVASWAGCYPQILAGVSGGLDSSVVATCLSAAGAEFSCLTLATPDPSGDEREFARGLAAYLGAVLAERWHALDAIDLDRSVVAHLPRPGGRIHELAYHDARRAVGDAAGADAFFTGNGGDNVFYNSRSARPVLDRLYCEGLGSGAFKTARDVAVLTGTGLIATSRETMRLARAGRGYRWRTDTRFLDPGVCRDLVDRATTHAWLEHRATALPGKSGQIAMLLRLQRHLDPGPAGDALPMIHPLAAQPIAECCLALPSWRMIEGGVDRAPIRRAFADRLPPLVLDRRRKGTPDSFVVRLLEAKLADIRERLLEGHLATNGLLARADLESALDRRSLLIGRDRPRLMQLLDTEAWCATWQARCSRDQQSLV